MATQAKAAPKTGKPGPVTTKKPIDQDKPASGTKTGGGKPASTAKATMKKKGGKKC